VADPTFADISKFTPNEQAALQYHRNHLTGGTGLKNADGSTTTLWVLLWIRQAAAQ
jgi:hypothetical protein